MSRLDEIRERHERMVQYCTWGKGGPEKQYRDDVGYLLSLLEVHPASEPPNTSRNVLVYELRNGWRPAFHIADNWHCAIRCTQLLSVVCWQEQPVFPDKYIEGARK